MTQQTSPYVLILTLGGTIAYRPSQSAVDFGLTALSAGELLGLSEDAPGVPPLRCEAVLQAASADLGFAQIAEVARRAREAIGEGACGVVVTQGTDTLEETAFLLDLLLDLPAPVVVTGALRNAELPGADGAANLLAAIRVAAAPAAAGLGVLVVMHDEIHAARFVRKAHTHKPSAFASPAAGPLGWIAEDRVRIVLRLAGSAPRIAWSGAAPDVPLITMGFGATAAGFARLVQDPPAGLIIAGFGVGHVPAALAGQIGALASEIPVVLASRVGSGDIFHGTYGHPGSERDLIGRGCIPAGYLDAPKARILLTMLLADGADRARVARTFFAF